MGNDNFLRACRKEETDFTPVWLMRQAGRYLQEYMDIKNKSSFIEMCKTPEVACEITMQPLRRFDLDASIIFADILLPLEGMGINFEFTKGDGPVIHNPVRSRADIDAIKEITPEEDVSYLMEAIKLTKKEIDGKVPLIGFCGAPFTLASYMIEGGGSKNYLHAKKLMYTDPESWDVMMTKITDMLVKYLKAQINAGVQAVQIFDSWAGCLSKNDYSKYALPYTKRLIKEVTGEVPVINFSTNTGTYLDVIKQAGGDVIGLDWKVDLMDGWNQLGDVAVQGNMDPAVLFSDEKTIRAKVKEVIDSAAGRKGHIFNLGHGIILGTPPENVKILVDAVHEFSAK